MRKTHQKIEVLRDRKQLQKELKESQSKGNPSWNFVGVQNILLEKLSV